MHRIALPFWILISLTFWLAGCADRIETARRTSFSAFNGTRIGDEAVSKFAIARTAFLISAEGLNITPSSIEPSGFRADIAGADVGLGSAVAIDRRGYFLTAAHCVKGSGTYILRGSATRGAWERATVVAKGDPSKHGPDFALLYVPTGTDEVFDWAPGYQVNDPVISVGPDRNGERVNIVCFAGKILKVQEGTTNDPYQAVITHTGPARQGDSGGPLLGLDGRLIAINIGSANEAKKEKAGAEPRTIAIRPQVTAVKAMIEEHARNLYRQQRSPAPM